MVTKKKQGYFFLGFTFESFLILGENYWNWKSFVLCACILIDQRYFKWFAIEMTLEKLSFLYSFLVKLEK